MTESGTPRGSQENDRQWPLTILLIGLATGLTMLLLVMLAWRYL
jgi:hypothetical protein